jgi:hypothetical protein
MHILDEETNPKGQSKGRAMDRHPSNNFCIDQFTLLEDVSRTRRLSSAHPKEVKSRARCGRIRVSQDHT